MSNEELTETHKNLSRYIKNLEEEISRRKKS